MTLAGSQVLDQSRFLSIAIGVMVDVAVQIVEGAKSQTQ